MKQSVLQGNEIFTDLSQSLENAQERIVVVTAWFTDQELLDILQLKQQQGVFVSIVIGDNKENEKLNFKEIKALGGTFTKVKGKGFGMMHQKYCIIDDNLCFHGSYNWTVNARKNNSESVIKTTHKATIQGLLDDYRNLTMEKEDITLEKSKSSKSSKSSKLSKWSNIFKKKEIKDEEVSEIATDNKQNEGVGATVDEVFNSIVSAEARQTDAEALKKRGYDLSKEVGGDDNVLLTYMNTLYHIYISDNSENLELKKKLEKKISEKKDELIELEEIDRAKKLASDDRFDLAKKQEFISKKTNLENDLILKEKDVEINLNTIKITNDKISANEIQINGLVLEFMKPPFNWFAFLPLAIFIIGLGLYLMLFYSSSLYIMIYSLQDSMELIKAGVPLADINPQVFDSKALINAFNKEGIAGIFIVLFFFVPLVIAYVSHLKDDLNEKRSVMGYVKMSLYYLIVFLIDGFIAAKVTNTIVEVKKAAKQLPPSYELTFNELIHDLNFWLVFCLGALPFIFLATLIEKLSIIFKARSPEIDNRKLKYSKNVLVKKNAEYQIEIDNLEGLNNSNEIELVRIKGEIKEVDNNNNFLPHDVESKKTLNNDLIDRRINMIKTKASMFLSNIENDNMSISSSTLKHRISVFSEGWNEWLHSHFANNIATTKSEEAQKTINIWLEKKNIITE